MDARTLLTLIYDEDQLNELAENIRRYPNEPIINLLERVFPATTQPDPTPAANGGRDGAVTGNDAPPPGMTWRDVADDAHGDWVAQNAELTRLRERADAAERERDELARELQAARTKQAEHSEIEDLLMERGELTPGVSLSKQVAGLLSKLETKRDVLEAECDDLQAERDELARQLAAAVKGVDNLSPLEALTRLLELRRRAGGS